MFSELNDSDSYIKLAINAVQTESSFVCDWLFTAVILAQQGQPRPPDILTGLSKLMQIHEPAL